MILGCTELPLMIKDGDLALDRGLGQDLGRSLDLALDRGLGQDVGSGSNLDPNMNLGSGILILNTTQIHVDAIIDAI